MRTAIYRSRLRIIFKFADNVGGISSTEQALECQYEFPRQTHQNNTDFESRDSCADSE